MASSRTNTVRGQAAVPPPKIEKRRFPVAPAPEVRQQPLYLTAAGDTPISSHHRFGRIHSFDAVVPLLDQIGRDNFGLPHGGVAVVEVVELGIRLAHVEIGLRQLRIGFGCPLEVGDRRFVFLAAVVVDTNVVVSNGGPGTRLLRILADLGINCPGIVPLAETTVDVGDQLGDSRVFGHHRHQGLGVRKNRPIEAFRSQVFEQAHRRREGQAQGLLLLGHETGCQPQNDPRENQHDPFPCCGVGPKQHRPIKRQPQQAGR